MKLVTGSNGFIGKRLLGFLIDSGFEAAGIDDEYLLFENWESKLVDCLDNLSPSEIFHVGACSNTLERDVQSIMIRNYEATKLISLWCKENNRKLIYSSTAASYGTNGRYPSNLYGWSKYTAEDFVKLTNGVALRYFNIYGPGEERKGNMSSFMHQAFLLKKLGKEVRIFPGKPRRDFVYIDDVVEANVLASDKFDDLRGNHYQVSTGEARTFEDMLLLAGIPFAYTDEGVPTGYQYFTCGNPSEWMPGWTPNYKLEAGVAKYSSYLREVYKTYESY